ncbi:hypothetical protein QJS10_CPA09g01933 [Acorus calamus]|uniref:UspA domain-containing protein n=1 Tax=Acorus calamus TaxID=4465 RepID=A0AAV9E3H1_ACOCL|nr:hypothetical protein QJS10_CPA09g01933 [Acorus calamus]
MSATAAAAPPRRVVMVVADPGRESTWALEWALSHAVLEHDELVLLHVDPYNSSSNNNHPRRQSSSGSGGGGGFPGLFRPRTQQSSEGQEFLENMRAACEAAQPTVKVRAEVAEMMEGKEGKALAVLSNAKAFAVDLLVIGQRRNSSFLGSETSDTFVLAGSPIYTCGGSHSLGRLVMAPRFTFGRTFGAEIRH